MKYVEAYETALLDHAQLNATVEEIAARLSSFKKGKFSAGKQKQNRKQNWCKKPCSGCGPMSHSYLEGEIECPAWGQNCGHCGKANHCNGVYRMRNNGEEQEQKAFVIIAHVCYTDSS